MATNASKRTYLEEISLLIDKKLGKDEIKFTNTNIEFEQYSTEKIFQMENETIKKADKLSKRKSHSQIESKKKSAIHIIEDNFETNNNLTKRPNTIDIESIIPEKQRKSKSKSKKVMKKSDLNINNSKKVSKIIVKNDGKFEKIDSQNKNIESAQNLLNSITPDIPCPSKLIIQIPVEAQKKDLIKELNTPNSKVGKNDQIVIRKKESKKTELKFT